MIELTLTFTQSGILICTLEKELEYWEETLSRFGTDEEPWVTKDQVEENIISIRGMLNQLRR